MLIGEEFDELMEAIAELRKTLARQKKKPFQGYSSRIIKAQFLKELCDLQYVLTGTVVSLGLADIFDEAFERVHDSNMSKLGDDGKPVVNEHGKYLKGKNYVRPVLIDLVDKF
jgi:predicted HAD superfamily Cof-like phosphohydrolase